MMAVLIQSDVSDVSDRSDGQELLKQKKDGSL